RVARDGDEDEAAVGLPAVEVRDEVLARPIEARQEQRPAWPGHLHPDLGLDDGLDLALVRLARNLAAVRGLERPLLRRRDATATATPPIERHRVGKPVVEAHRAAPGGERIVP